MAIKRLSEKSRKGNFYFKKNSKAIFRIVSKTIVLSVDCIVSKLFYEPIMISNQQARFNLDYVLRRMLLFKLLK